MLEAAFVALLSLVLAWAIGRRSHLRLRMRLELLTVVLAVLGAGAYVLGRRMTAGLGAVTNLSDQVPWGLWITFDLCGVALAAGGFLLAATVHIFRLRRFEPILRPTVLTAFLAYVLVAAVLVLDLGRPQRFWHPLIMWQPHSVMFEITLCLSLYTLVLALEFSPAVLERLGWHQAAEALHRLALPMVIVGAILSTLHQSSFGSLFLIVPHKLHALWYTPALPALFLLSAVCAGIAAVIVESCICERFLGRRLAPELLARLGRVVGAVLCVYAAWKIADVLWRGAWTTLDAPRWLGASWAAEVLGGAVLPAWWLLCPRPAGSTRGLAPAASLVMAGVVWNRVNISWLGLAPSSGILYLPSWMEWLITAALAVAGAVAFLAISRLVPVFPHARSAV